MALRFVDSYRDKYKSSLKGALWATLVQTLT